MVKDNVKMNMMEQMDMEQMFGVLFDILDKWKLYIWFSKGNLFITPKVLRVLDVKDGHITFLF